MDSLREGEGAKYLQVVSVTTFAESIRLLSRWMPVVLGGWVIGNHVIIIGVCLCVVWSYWGFLRTRYVIIWFFWGGLLSLPFNHTHYSLMTHSVSHFSVAVPSLACEGNPPGDDGNFRRLSRTPPQPEQLMRVASLLPSSARWATERQERPRCRTLVCRGRWWTE